MTSAQLFGLSSPIAPATSAKTITVAATTASNSIMDANEFNAKMKKINAKLDDVNLQLSALHTDRISGGTTVTTTNLNDGATRHECNPDDHTNDKEGPANILESNVTKLGNLEDSAVYQLGAFLVMFVPLFLVQWAPFWAVFLLPLFILLLVHRRGSGASGNSLSPAPSDSNVNVIPPPSDTKAPAPPPPPDAIDLSSYIKGLDANDLSSYIEGLAAEATTLAAYSTQQAAGIADLLATAKETTQGLKEEKKNSTKQAESIADLLATAEETTQGLKEEKESIADLFKDEQIAVLGDRTNVLKDRANDQQCQTNVLRATTDPKRNVSRRSRQICSQISSPESNASSSASEYASASPGSTASDYATAEEEEEAKPKAKADK